MRIRLASCTLALFLLAACGGGSSSGEVADDPTTTSTTAVSSTNGDGSSGGVDCTAARAAAQRLGLNVQLLAQIRNPGSIETFRSGSLKLDIDGFTAAVEDLRVLEPFDEPPFGSPREALDLYAEAGVTAKVLLEADQVTQADIDAYNAKIGTVGEFLSGQTKIAGALDAAGCQA